jgi:glycosyltransferase involved in cell wall biosynthesis
LTKIVISKWLLNYAHQINQKVWYIPNGLDFDKFSIDVPVEERNPANILMMFHSDKVKGSEYGLRALNDLKKEMPNLTVTFFSVTPKSVHIPDWVNYVYQPAQEQLRKLYNNSSIFISPSLFEGFPLPPAEAMMCGSAIIATDIGGHREYCIDNETALLVKPKSEEDIYRRTKELINNASLRIKIAKNGNKFIKQFTWNDAINKMEEILALQL